MQELRRSHKKLVIGMAGLPARGKTHISFKITRFLNWLGYKSKHFSLHQVMKEEGLDFNPELFDPQNEQSVKITEEYSIKALERIIKYMNEEGGEVAIYNASNATKSIRIKIKDHIIKSIPHCQMFWVESICNKPDVIQKNIIETKLENYKDVSKEEAERDFFNRLQKMENKYEPVDESYQTSYIKLIDIGQHIYIHQIDGYLQSKIVSFLMNLHIYQRPIYFCRHGESQFNQQNKIGGDSNLTQNGLNLAYAFASFFQKEFENLKNKHEIKVFSSTMKRSIVTAEIVSKALGIECMKLKTLDELDYGLCDGLSYQEIAMKFPDKIKEREKDKLRFRYPRGESYLDAISRIEPVIFEIERYRTPVILIGHQAIMRCLYAYFHQNEVVEIPSLDIPLNVVVKLVPKAYTCTETRIPLDVPKSIQ